jgi:hypothetical protein
MSVFTGPMYPGAMREHRRILREEAEARNARTPQERTAKYRREHPQQEEVPAEDSLNYFAGATY